MTVATDQRLDPNTNSNYTDFVTRKISLTWNIDFAKQNINGIATLTLTRTASGKSSSKLLLDASHLEISSVKVAEQKAEFRVLKANKFGGTLEIAIPLSIQEPTVAITYRTTENCTALQWLEPQQTSGKYPFVFSQCQAIHARSLLPCQDTPSIKCPYEAVVTILDQPADSPLTVLMSANERTVTPNGVSFKQTMPIPSYLIALAAGELVSAPLSDRTCVWAEPALLQCAVHEFVDADNFINIAENLVGPYRWGPYQILVLPPSFPYGGMENPCLTFLTPSLLCGDRSLVDVVAHEIAHSWTGNLVSCSSWEHFWLNEGFTMFLERKILARLHGNSWREFNSLLGLTDLRESIALFREEEGKDGPATSLVQDLTQTDPDEVFSTVPYEKGYTLLTVLERLVTPSKFEVFFKDFIQDFAEQSIDSSQFRQYCVLKLPELTQFAWDSWLHGRGMPPSVPDYDRSMLDRCEELASSFCSTQKSIKLNDWQELSPSQQVMFLDVLLQSAKTLTCLESLDATLGISCSKNVEVLLKWHLLVIRAGHTHGYAQAAKFATMHGRMKYCRPVLRELATSGEEGRQLALDTFSKNKEFYHPIASRLILADLKLN